MSYLEERRNQKIYGKKAAEKKVYSIPKKGVKKLAEEKAAKEDGTDAAMDKWFEDRGKELTGACLLCGGKTEKAKPIEFYLQQENEDDVAEEKYQKALFLQRCSVAHLFPKKDNFGGFPSIALHPENSIELCYYGKSHHTNFDNHMIELYTIKEQYPDAWLEILRKTSILYPVMTEAEKNKVPEILLTALKIQS